MSLEQAIIVVVNWLALSTATGLIFVMLIQPERDPLNWWFSLLLLALALWAYFAMARSIPDLSPFGETDNFYVLFVGLAIVPAAFYGYVVHLCQPQDGIALVLRAWSLVFIVALVALLWTDHVVAYRETGGQRVELSFKLWGYVTAAHIGVYLVMSYLYLHISPRQQVKPLRYPAAVLLIGYASNIPPALRLPPLGIGLATVAALLIGHRMLRWQLFNPLREVREELNVANRDLRQMSSDLAAARVAPQRLEDELREATRAKNEFLTNMSHRLRTPLNSIVGYSELMLKGVYGPITERQQDRLGKIHRNGLGLLDVISNILDLNRIEGGRLPLELDSVRVGALADSVVSDSQPRVEGAPLAVRAELDRPLRLIRADEMRIRQALANLVDNAIKFTGEGEVRVTARNVTVKNGKSDEFQLPLLGWLSDRAWIVLSVEDTGPGIPPEQQATLFDEASGSGLGLPIARRLVEMHTGRIWVKSQPGQGSRFFVALPAQNEFEMFEGETVRSDLMADVVAIVEIVTGDDENALRLTHALERQNYRAIRAKDAPSALARAREFHPAAILVDLLTPDFAGWDAIRRLKQDPATARIPIILTTVRDDRLAGVPLGSCAVVAKPAQREELLAALGRIQQDALQRPVLIVDDDPGERSALVEFLRGEGVAVIGFGDGAAAVDWLRQPQNVAGLALIDLIMPQVSGFEILRELRHIERFERVPVVLLYPDPARISPADAAAMNEFVRGVVEQRGREQFDALACVAHALSEDATPPRPATLPG